MMLLYCYTHKDVGMIMTIAWHYKNGCGHSSTTVEVHFLLTKLGVVRVHSKAPRGTAKTPGLSRGKFQSL